MAATAAHCSNMAIHLFGAVRVRRCSPAMIQDVRRLCSTLVRRVRVHVRLQWPPVDLTSPVAAIQLAAGVFFQDKWPAADSTSPVAANQLAAGAFFRRKRPPRTL